MKKIVLTLALASFAFVSCKKNEDASSKINSETVTSENTTAPEVANSIETSTTETVKDGTPVATFNKTEHDFGSIKKGSRNETEFEITNSGNTDLVIINASASCGCTVPEYPKTPIKPGNSAKIKVAFNASSVGNQSKTVTLTTNTATGTELLTIKANVEE